MEIKCPNCGSTHIVRFGYVITFKKGRRQRYQCQDCGKTFVRERTNE